MSPLDLDMYDTLDMAKVHQAARTGPSDLTASLGALRDALRSR